MDPIQGDLDLLVLAQVALVGVQIITTLVTLALLKSLEDTMSAQFDALAAQVRAHTSVVDSAIALIRGLVVKLNECAAGGADPAAVQALADELAAKSAELAAAVQENTPAPPAEPPAQ